jgi:hypothetical protein
MHTISSTTHSLISRMFSESTYQLTKMLSSPKMYSKLWNWSMYLS